MVKEVGMNWNVLVTKVGKDQILHYGGVEDSTVALYLSECQKSEPIAGIMNC